jgi:hypothetical protein
MRNATAVEYASLLSRAFDGAITVGEDRIVAHKSGMLFVRTPQAPKPQRTPVVVDADNNWADV